MSGPVAVLLSDGRLHLQHGPIDLIISADGEGDGPALAMQAAARRFATILDELAGELPRLRAASGPDPEGLVAMRMADAVRPHAARSFVTPMAAVAGAVADEVLDTMTAAAPLSRAIVNNGGDIAVHLAPGAAATARIAALSGRPTGTVRITSRDGIGGIATSGRGGRSLSLGIADSVTVLARSAAAADAAATLVANAVDLPGHPAVRRAPAVSLDPDSDLGDRLAVTGCGALGPEAVAAALARGAALAEVIAACGDIKGAAIMLRGTVRVAGSLPLLAPHSGSGE